MILQSDVTIVSAYGRGNWLAAELSNLNHRVSLVDVSKGLGRWAPEDWEGPFGFFQSEHLLPSQVESLIEEDFQETVDEGFVVWLKDGPVECKGPLSQFQLKRSGLSEESLEYLSSFEVLSPKQKKDLAEKLNRQDFDHKWLIHLSHQLAANCLLPNAKGANYGRSLPLFAPYFVRRVTRRGTQRGWDWCAANGVDVYGDAEVTDISWQKNECGSLEIKSRQSGALRSRYYVWLLSSEETYFLNKKLGESIFPTGYLDSEWSWLRYRVEFDGDFYRDIVPIKFLVIQDEHLPWTHDNLLWVQRALSDQTFDVWVRIPTHHRFQSSYIEGIGTKICDALGGKFPQGKPYIQEMPQEVHYAYTEVGPPRHPVFNMERLKRFPRPNYKNFICNSSEGWPQMGWCGMFRNHQQLMDSMRATLETKNKSQKEEENDREIHSP